MATKRTPEEIIAGARARAEAAEKRTAASEKKAPKPKQLSLEFWPDAVRGVPNAFLRNALFGTSNTRKTHKRRTLITAVEQYEVRFKGETFNQTDLDVWETLLHLARLQPLGTKVEFTAHALLKELGRGTGGKDHEQLKEELARLGSGWTEITDKKARKTFAGNFISSYVRDDATERYVVSFTPEMAQLYEAGHTLIDLEQRRALGRNNLAKWLHGHYASHAKPFAYKVETLRELTASETAELRKFRQLLKKAHDALKAVGAIQSWTIDPKTDLVEVVNLPSQTQLKHLAKSKKRPKSKPG
ncbi:MAG: replication initiator protein A [Rhodoferax sp.]|jgi:hypothetical protein|nr:replication initiator protein A [Rhodoferax sp.]